MPSASSSAGLEAVGKPRRDVAAHDDAINHDVDIVLQLLVEHRRLADLEEDAVEA